MNKVELTNLIKQLIAKEIKTNSEEVNVHTKFFELGLDSISAMYMIEELENRLSITISPLDFWDYPTIEKLSDRIMIKYL